MNHRYSNKINYKLFTQTPTKESSYMLGLMWADGYVNKKTNSMTIEILKADMDEIYPLFEGLGEFNVYTRKNNNNRLSQMALNCYSLELSQFLKEKDYTIKSTVSPTKILNHLPKNLHRYFFLGWSDGDGCFYHSKDFKTNQFIMSGSYDQDWSSLENLCKELNIYYIINKFITKKGHKHSRLIICRNNDIISLGDYFYNNNELISLSKKIKKFKSIKKYVTDKKTHMIECYKNGEIIKRFGSLKEASDWVNRGRYVGGSINDSIIGRQKSAYGYNWNRIRIDQIQYDLLKDPIQN